MKNAITIKHLTKTYKLYKQPIDRLKESLSLSKKSYHKEFSANEEISFDIKKGEVVGIIGKNGCGKSTLLKMITGVLTPTDGSIHVSGKITALLELGAGFNPEMTGLENLYLAGSVSGISQEQMDTKVDEIVAFAEIGEFIYQPLKTYSSGMKARLGFAFAINIDPEILIIDEALSVGDAAFQRKCYAKIEYMCSSQDVTVLFVSHAGEVIKQLCSRAIMLHDGKLLLDGEPKKVVNLYEKFLGSKDLDTKKLQAAYAKMLEDEDKPQTKPTSKSYFNPNLISKSMVELPANGAKISDVMMLDSDGNIVNIIEKNSIYVYCYKVVFFNNYTNVNFSMRIKNVKGIVLTGHAQNIKTVTKEKEYFVKFEFVNILNNGEYFFNAGTSHIDYGDFNLLHKINDAYMIKVLDDDKDETSRGIVNFNFKGSH